MSSPSRSFLESASPFAGTNAPGTDAHHSGEDHAAQGAERERRADLRMLVYICAASSALTLATLYSIASKLNLF